MGAGGLSIRSRYREYASVMTQRIAAESARVASRGARAAGSELGSGSLAGLACAISRCSPSASRACLVRVRAPRVPGGLDLPGILITGGLDLPRALVTRVLIASIGRLQISEI